MQSEWMTGGPRVHHLTRSEVPGGFATAVSLHAHTHHSQEVMTSVPDFLDRIPVVAGLFRREIRRYLERNSEAVDFAKGWWHPPVGPEAVLDSETAQIVEVLRLRPLVSITDHDSIEAGLALHTSRPHQWTPLSFEWTVPFQEAFFHVGVHNLEAESALSIFSRLLSYTRRANSARLSDLLDELNAYPKTLLVLNHPLWDLAGMGPARHAVLLSRFLIEHGSRIHALEANGYRSWRENAAVGALAEKLSFPLISGGDRHGYAPNSLLNLTSTTSFGDFVGEIREERVSNIAAMPQYRKPLVARKLTVAADVLRTNPSNPPGQQHWTDRVSCECEGTVGPLSNHWPKGGPLWVRLSMRAFRLLTSAPLLPALAFMTVMVAGPPVGASDPIASMETTESAPSATASHAAVAE